MYTFFCLSIYFLTVNVRRYNQNTAQNIWSISYDNICFYIALTHKLSNFQLVSAHLSQFNVI